MRIDAHSHVWLENDRLAHRRLEGLIDACERLAIDEAWVSCPITRGMGTPEEVRRCNDAVLEAMRLHPPACAATALLCPAITGRPWRRWIAAWRKG